MMPRRILSSHFIRVMAYTILFILLSIAAGQAPTADHQAIRQVDFKNFAYQPDCIGDDRNHRPTIRVKNGSFTREKEDDRLYFEVREVVYGDLTGDGQEEAVVLTLCNTGGTGQFTDGIVFTMRQGRPAVIATLGIGDRADGGIHEVKIENGLLKVSRYGGTSGACCPDYIETYTFRMSGGKLAPVGKPVREDFVDHEGSRSVQRVRFQKGSTTATLKGSTAGTAEYLLGARAGQAMTLRITGRDLSLRLMSPDGSDLGPPVLNTPLTVKLPASGDYRIVIETAKGRADYTLEVTIR
ncbi:MAG: hypothetical protein U0Z53_08905 [Blastocatellia bacterium]